MKKSTSKLEICRWGICKAETFALGERCSDGLDHYPVTGCEHAGFESKRGCRKHVKTKHGWYYYFDEKPPYAVRHVQQTKATQIKRVKQYPAVRQTMTFLVHFPSGFKAVAAAENLVNNRIFQ